MSFIGCFYSGEDPDRGGLTYSSIEAVIDRHDLGDFSASAVLADLLTRDARVFATIQTRVLGVLGLPFAMDTGRDTDDGRKCASWALDWWFEFLPESVQATLLRWLLLMGFALGELWWTPDEDTGELRPNLHVHHPQFVSYKPDGYGGQPAGWYLRTINGEIRVTPGDGRWVLLTRGNSRPWMDGVIRCLAIPKKRRAHAWTDWSRRSEVEGTGIKKATIPDPPDPSDGEEARAKYDENVVVFTNKLDNLGAESTLAIPPGYGLDIEAIDASAAVGFKLLIDACDTDITLAILGQNLTTQIEGGSFAAATVHARVQLDRIKSDVEALATELRAQVLWVCLRLNRPNARRAILPWPRHDHRPPEDRAKEANTLLSLGQALTLMKANRVKTGPILERFGLEAEEDDPVDVQQPADAAKTADQKPKPAQVEA